DVLAGVGRDEAEALRVVEPLHRALHAALGRSRGRGCAHRPRTAARATSAIATVATVATVAAVATARAGTATLRCVEAVAAQHGPARRGHERDFRLAPAVRTRRRIHLLLAAAIAAAAPAPSST